LRSRRLPIGRFLFRWRIVGSRVGKIIVVGRVGKVVVVCTIVHDGVVDKRSLRSLFTIICVVCVVVGALVLIGAVEIQIATIVVIVVVFVAVFVILIHQKVLYGEVTIKC
jgi:hypothetical protein